MEKIVKKRYNDIGSPYAFGGVERIYHGVKDLGYNISKNRIKKYCNQSLLTHYTNNQENILEGGL